MLAHQRLSKSAIRSFLFVQVLTVLFGSRSSILVESFAYRDSIRPCRASHWAKSHRITSSTSLFDNLTVRGCPSKIDEGSTNTNRAAHPLLLSTHTIPKQRPLNLGPPEELMSLNVGESFHPIPETPVSITRLAYEPDMFLFRNFLPFEADRMAVMEEAVRRGMDHAETKSGTVLHRKRSYISWINPDDEDDEPQVTPRPGREVAQFMTRLTTHLFVDPHYSSVVRPEHVQVVRYESGGKFDLHHDGFHRFLTVLTYLNGVAGTWFPYALTSREEVADAEKEVPPTMMLEGEGMAKDKIPGVDGLWVVGVEHESGQESTATKHVVRIEPGDAVVFYNYQWTDDVELGDVEWDTNLPLMKWRSIHSALPTNREKWIATNWFVYDEQSAMMEQSE